jgi:predicted glycosyltransferase
VGGPLLEAVVRAFDQLNAPKPCRLKVFSGPFLERENLGRLKKMAGQNVQIEKFTPDFLSYLAAADLSVSMGGYNTTMNILASGVPALVWPFPQNREQRLRAGRLAEAGVLQVIDGEDLDPDRLAGLMEQMLASPRPRPAKFDLDGAVNTAAWLAQRFKEKPG